MRRIGHVGDGVRPLETLDRGVVGGDRGEAQVGEVGECFEVVAGCGHGVWLCGLRDVEEGLEIGFADEKVPIGDDDAADAADEVEAVEEAVEVGGGGLEGGLGSVGKDVESEEGGEEHDCWATFGADCVLDAIEGLEGAAL